MFAQHRLMGPLGLVLLTLYFMSPLAARERLTVYDTGVIKQAPLPIPATPEALAKREGWKKLAKDQAQHTFKGEAFLANKHIALVLRTGATAAELYSKSKHRLTLRGRLLPLGLGEGAKVISTKITARSASEVTIHATFKGAAKEGTMAYSLKMDEPIIKTKSVIGVEGLRFHAPARLGVLPDFFADDMVIDATKIPIDRTEVPGENFFLQMIDGGNAIVAAIWDKNDSDVELLLKGKDKDRKIEAVHVRYGKDGSIWAAVLEQEGIWSQLDVPEKPPRQLHLGRMPYRAKWKANLMRNDGSVNSWSFIYHPKSRSRWSGVAGGFNYPTWIDGAEDNLQGHIELPYKFLKMEKGSKFLGPTVVYAIDRNEQTPMSAFTVTDLMRNSLGTGPCEYIMDVSGNQSSDKGIFTCSFEATLNPLFDSDKLKRERRWVGELMDDVQIFIKAIQDRINVYVVFRADMLAYLAEQKKANPDQAEFITEMEKLTSRITNRKANGLPNVKKLIDQLRPEVTADHPKVSVHSVTRSVAGIGLGQDNLVARCRVQVKALRNKATLAMAINPKGAEIAKEIRKRTRAILRNPLGHELN